MSSARVNGSGFVNQFNAFTGQNEWKIRDNDYDFHQEIARSGYADMLNDEDRNAKYFNAITSVIKHLKSQNKTVNVLDIGTGTGLLSMMASKAGADSITACEAFVPMAKCAIDVLKSNNVHNVSVIPKRSTELIIGEDLPERANLLVCELVDTELIGEAALNTHAHAIRYLLTPDAICIPYSADLFLQIVESPFLWSHHRLSNKPYLSEKVQRLFASDPFPTCPGAPSVFDIQASQLSERSKTDDDDRESFSHSREFRCLLPQPARIKRFAFGPPIENINFAQSAIITSSLDGKELKTYRPGHAHAFIVWWRLKLNPFNDSDDGDINTAPTWINDSHSAWRDHWMQAVYFPSHLTYFQTHQPIPLRFCHDSISMWFDLADPVIDQSPDLALSPLSDRPLCRCGLHLAFSRSRLAYVNSPAYDQLIDTIANRALELSRRNHDKPALYLIVSDSSLLPLYLARRLLDEGNSDSWQIVHLDACYYSFKAMQRIYAQLDNQSPSSIRLFDSVKAVTSWLDSGLDQSSSNIFLLSEPYSSGASLPCDSLTFWSVYLDACRNFRVRLVSPVKLQLWALAIHVIDLWKIAAPVNKSRSQGFNLDRFNQLVCQASCLVDQSVEPHPLWEYECHSVPSNQQPVLVYQFDFDEDDPSSLSLSLDAGDPVDMLLGSGTNAIVFWTDWFANDKLSSSSGPSLPLTAPNQTIEWPVGGNGQQGLFLLPTTDWVDHEVIGVNNSLTHSLSVKLRARLDTVVQKFCFQIERKS